MLYVIPDAALIGASFFVSTRNSIETLIIADNVQVIITGGYASKDDGGEGFYYRVNAEPTNPGKVQSSDGAWWQYKPIGDGANPNAFGAVGDGLTNDFQAFSDCIEYINDVGGGIECRGADYTYYINTLDFEFPLIENDGAFINGNSSSLVFGKRSGLDWPTTVFKTVFYFSGCNSPTIRNFANIDLGGFQHFLVLFDQCDNWSVEDIYCENSSADNQSGAVGAVRSNNGNVSLNGFVNLGFGCYMGHTIANYEEYSPNIHDNYFANLAADTVNGLCHNLIFDNNICDTYFATAVAGSKVDNTYSTNASIRNNTFINYVAHGVQTDVVGNDGTADDIFINNLIVQNNLFLPGADSGPTATAVQCLYCTNAKISGNSGLNCVIGLLFGGVENATGNNNDFINTDGTGSKGIIMSQADVTSFIVNNHVFIKDNVLSGFDVDVNAAGIDLIEGSFIFVENNTCISCTTGIRNAANDLTSSVINKNTLTDNTNDIVLTSTDVAGILDNSYNSGGASITPIVFADGDTTPGVGAYGFYQFANTGATNVTGFDNMVNNQIITVWSTNANTTLIHGAPLRTPGGLNINLAANTFTRIIQLNNTQYILDYN